ncbi:MAG: hypothetical protein ABIQ44_00035 [Chloroflexia bacterium]
MALAADHLNRLQIQIRLSHARRHWHESSGGQATVHARRAEHPPNLLKGYPAITSCSPPACDPRAWPARRSGSIPHGVAALFHISTADSALLF